jgi:hypothetical protein
MRDVHGTDVSLDPPPLDAVLTSPVADACAAHGRVQTRAHDIGEAPTDFGGARAAASAVSEVCDAEIAVTAPVSVVALVRDTLDAFSEPGTPRWLALERILQHVIACWEALPRHRDPVFARDGWRCTVPGCSSRRNLHDHHLVFRSRGGANQRKNRIAVCAAHHLHGIHGGSVRASGTAPHDVLWELGLRRNGPALLAFVGDRRCVDEQGRAAGHAASFG